MTWLTLAVKNVRHNARNYAAFFLSSSFAIWMFFLFGALLFHPQFQGKAVSSELRWTLYLLETAVATFSVFFIFHSFSAFLKARQRELALLALLGAGPGQVSRLLYAEALLMGAGAICVGLLLGMVSSKLFFLGFGRVMGLEQRFAFHLAPEAIGLTVITFGLIFGVVTLLGHRLLRKRSILDLMQGAVRSQVPPTVRPWLAALAPGSLAVAGWLGTTATLGHIVSRLGAMLLLVALAIWLICFQGGTVVLRLLQRNRRVYWRDTNLIILAQLAFKLKENARTLFLVSMLSGIALAMAAQSLAGIAEAESFSRQLVPVSLQLVGASPERLEAVLAEEGLEVVGSAHGQVLRTQIYLSGDAVSREAVIMRAGEFAMWVEQVTGGRVVTASAGRGALVPALSGMGKPTVTSVEVWFGQEAVPLSVEGHAYTPTFNLGYVEYVLVVDEALFGALQAKFGAEASQAVHGYAISDLRSALPAARRIQQAYQVDTSSIIGAFRNAPFTATSIFHDGMIANNGITLFLSCFVAVLFFLASGNLLYFKLFTDLREDRAQMQALFKLGVGRKEVGRILGTQTFLLFFIPLPLASTIAGIGAVVIDAVYNLDVWRYGAVALGVYAICQMGYYLVTRHTYIRSLRLPL